MASFRKIVKILFEYWQELETEIMRLLRGFSCRFCYTAFAVKVKYTAERSFVHNVAYMHSLAPAFHVDLQKKLLADANMHYMYC